MQSVRSAVFVRSPFWSAPCASCVCVRSCSPGFRAPTPWVGVEGMGQLKRGLEMLALGDMCCEGMQAVEKGFCCWVKSMFRAWGQLKRGFEVFAPGRNVC